MLDIFTYFNYLPLLTYTTYHNLLLLLIINYLLILIILTITYLYYIILLTTTYLPLLSFFPEARPKWQYLPAVPGYVPVYIRPGDTPLYEINPELAEAFHALPAGRSASKLIDASPELPEQVQGDQLQDQPQGDQPRDDIPVIPDESAVDRRPYEKKVQKKKATEITKPVERR